MHEFFDFGKDYIETALAVDGFAYGIVHLPSAVDGQHDVFHFAVEKIDGVVIEKKGVCGGCKQKLFAVLFALFAGVGHHVFYDVEAHERFAAEEIGFENAAFAAVGYQKVYRLFCRLFAHEFARRVIGSFVGETIAAAKIAVVADVYAQSLYLVGLDGIRFNLFRFEKAAVF